MAKRLVVCLDGTWHSADHGHPTNVVRIMPAILPVDEEGVAQIVFYDAGVGADGGLIDRLVEGATGRGVEQNLRDGYRFLAHNWLPGDEIYVFGFSRGAFTARSLCGFIDLIGLLPARHMDRLDEAWRLYRAPRHERDQAALARLTRAARRDVKVRCLGVWDTVGALGVPLRALQRMSRKHRFHDAELSSLVECAFHALAIDERRGSFGPVLWQAARGQRLAKVVEQVWFPGAHANVGGGGPDTGVADLALTWMIRRVQANAGLAFDESYIRQQLRPDPLGAISDSRSWLYALGRVAPFDRLLGQHPIRRAWRGGLARLLGRFGRRTNRPTDGCEFVNEMIHWSAVERFGKQAPQDGRRRRYAPANLAAALASRMLIADERLLTRHRRPATTPRRLGPTPAHSPRPGARAA